MLHLRTTSVTFVCLSRGLVGAVAHIEPANQHPGTDL